MDAQLTMNAPRAPAAYTVVAYIPAHLKTAGDAISAGMGWGGVAYSRPLVPDPEAAPTHFLMSATNVSPVFVGWLEGEPLPGDLAEKGLDPAQVAFVIGQIEYLAEDLAARPDPVAMREKLLAEHGLELVREGE